MQCKKSDPGLSECIKKSLQFGVPHLVKGRILESLFCSRKFMFIKINVPGIPNLGLLPIDPLRITELGIDQGSGPVSIKLNFRDLDISNIGTAKINEL